MPRLITKRVSKRTGRSTWQVRVRIGTKPNGAPAEIVRSFKRKRDATNFVAKVIRDRVAGTAVQPTRITLNAYLDRWLETTVSRSVRPQTAASYRDILARYIRPGLGCCRLDQLTALGIQRHLQALAERTTTKALRDARTELHTRIERHLAPRTVRLAHSILSAALKQAVRWRLLARNPAADVEPPRQPRREMRALGRDDAARFLEAVRGTKHEALFTLALATGMRPSEYLGLKWDDLNLDNSTIMVRRTLVRIRGGWAFGEPKTARGRRALPIPPSLVEVLRRHRAHQLEQRMAVADMWEDHGLVFTNGAGQPLERRNLVHRHFKALLRAAGLPSTLRLYDLRHSAATLLLTAGVHPKVASERLGHSSIVMTLDTYSHVMPDMQKDASDRIEDILFGRSN